LLQHDYIENLKERIAYLERRDEMYMKLNDEVEDTRKRLENVAHGTVAMASDLVEARETAIRNEELANALLKQHAASTESEMQMLQHHISVADAVLQHISGVLKLVC
jgi:predicted  nucleic acid-binding Zn-ribbon protein